MRGPGPTTIQRSPRVTPVPARTTPTIIALLPPGTVYATVTQIVDGDTVHVLVDSQDHALRLIGINTPEITFGKDEPYGQEAKAALAHMLAGGQVYLDKDVSETDQYGRLLRYVYLPDGTFVNAELVRLGYAQAVTYPPDVAQADLFREMQREAREAGRGLWGLPITAEPTVTERAATPSASTGYTCDKCIKGNISSSGEKIYHFPGCRDYDKTVITESKGERWFSSEAEAKAAGWRRAQNCPQYGPASWRLGRSRRKSGVRPARYALEQVRGLLDGAEDVDPT